uniref:long-chain-fatty-acid--CoA ligase n=1 Tax=Trichuris muris TaxID=70415 RepID=A0A5S6R1B8_TRIMR
MIVSDSSGSLFILFVTLIAIWCLRNRDFLRRAWRTLPRDFKGISTLIRVQWFSRLAARYDYSADMLFDRVVKKYPHKRALEMAGTENALTFSELQRLSWRIANYFVEKCCLKQGDVVAIFMQNRPECGAFLLGTARQGLILAQLNFNLRLDSLAHCLNAAEAKCLVVEEKLLPYFQETVNAKLVSDNLLVLVYGDDERETAYVNLKRELQTVSDEQPKDYRRAAGCKTVLSYIYTSGTTGMPKPAKITHARYMMMVNGVRLSFGIKPEDRIYVTMPLYHTSGGIIASHFWKDCSHHRCTVALYIGEICRYLLSQPLSDLDKKHGVRMMYGNGLRPQIWEAFVERFGIKQICELYGSTEGNTSILNMDNKVGACGFLTIYQFLSPLYPIGLVKVDERTGKLVRNKDGLCIRCLPGESGELVGTVVKGNPVKEFCGYLSENDTKRKLERNVFRRNDVAFRSGDILHMDEYGYLYFKDRTGDTFRWKGENVSTSEVEGLIQRVAGLADAAVYGVMVPGTEGRAGMASIVDEKGTLDLTKLLSELSELLPKYAIPVFIRLCSKVNLTGTHKLIKSNLQADGYDQEKCGKDALFYLNVASRKYEPLDSTVYSAILSGKIRF